MILAAKVKFKSPAKGDEKRVIGYVHNPKTNAVMNFKANWHFIKTFTKVSAHNKFTAYSGSCYAKWPGHAKLEKPFSENKDL